MLITQGASIAPPYLDLPAPLGLVVAEYRIEPATAIAYAVKAGQYIQIIDVAGAQCSDFLAFAAPGYQAELDRTVTRTLNGTAMPQAGLHSKYFPKTMQPLVEVIQDTCGRHDSFILDCTDRYYEDAGYPGHPSCSDNFNRALQSYGIVPRPGWAAVNFFYNTSLDCHGNIVGDESWSRPGDYVLLKAHQDLLCASSACPDDIDPINGWLLTPIHIRIYEAGENFARAIGRRAVLIDLTALRKFEVTGPKAMALLQYTFSRNLEKQGKPRAILPHNLPLTMVGLMLIFVGFYAFLAACVVFLPGQSMETTIYGTPMTLASLGVSTTLALAAGIIGAYIGSKADPFYTISGGLAGIICVGGGLDLYHPAIVIVIAFIAAFFMPKVGSFVERSGIDDAVGAVAVHGFCGVIGAMTVGVLATGYPQGDGIPTTNFLAQLIGTFVCTILLGFIPGYGCSFILKKLNPLRVPEQEEITGLDLGDFGLEGYPEYSIVTKQGELVHDSQAAASVLRQVP